MRLSHEAYMVNTLWPGGFGVSDNVMSYALRAAGERDKSALDFELALTEGSMTNKGAKYMKQRERTYHGQTIHRAAHQGPPRQPQGQLPPALLRGRRTQAHRHRPLQRTLGDHGEQETKLALSTCRQYSCRLSNCVNDKRHFHL